MTTTELSNLVPNYLDVDFATLKDRLQQQIKDSTIFQDVNYEGANITLLIELMAYIGELTTYYLNKIAKNVYIDTADIYENVHRIANMMGYYPPGYISSSTTLTLTISGGCSPYDELKVEAWKELDSTKEYNGETISFVTTTSVEVTASELPFTITVPVRQGRLKEYSYTGAELIDNTIYLPFLNFDNDDDLEDDYPSCKVEVNGEEWLRISDFYDNLSGLQTEDNVYVMRYNKYGQYVVEFNSTRNVPTSTDTISVTLLESFGAYGNVGANTITGQNDELIANLTTALYLENDHYNVTNTSASIGGQNPESINDIKTSAKEILFSQYRTVTKADYVAYLRTRSDVSQAAVWGEQEIAPSGSIEDYNKVYVTVIPQTWSENTISYNTTADGMIIPISWSQTWQNEISQFLELRKMLCAWEVFTTPKLIYFRINMGIKIKRNYRFISVQRDLKNKLSYYFTPSLRDFAETVSFTDIHSYLLDPNQTSSTDTFSQTKGIQNLIIRNIDWYDIETDTWRDPYEYLSVFYPQYLVPLDADWDENVLREIQLGADQFPMLSIVNCVIEEE